MATLQVPGARLYYEVSGANGPFVLLIPGGSGEAGSFAPLAPKLATTYTVVSYDRRGFSRSPLDEPPQDDERIVADVDDAARLIEHLGGKPANVLGSSSGAIVALELLARRPECVRTLIAHEPPLMTLLPDAEEQLAFNESVYATYQRDGLQQAMQQFMRLIGAEGGPQPAEADMPAHFQEMMNRLQHNMTFWMEHELLVYPQATPDMAALGAHADRLVLAGGAGSRQQALPPYRPNTVLADRLGLDIEIFPGGHNGYRTHPDTFADRLSELLA